MIDAQLTVTRPDLFSAYAEGLQKAPDFTNQVVNDTVNRVADHVLERFHALPGPAVHPIQWTSERQRKAFFATKGFGSGIPYVRKSPGLVDRWKLVVLYMAGIFSTIVLSNDSPIEQYVTGINQQPFHAATGWYQSGPLMEEAGMELVDAIETDMIKVLYLVEGYAEEHSGS